MPVEVIRCEQGEHPYRRRRRRVSGLKTRELYDEHVVRVVVVKLGHGTAEVSGESDVEAVGAKDRGGEHGGSRLALGPGHRYDSPVLEVFQEECCRSRHDRTAAGGCSETLVIARHARGVDDEVETPILEDRRRQHLELG